MTSEKKAEANRRNALKSTGPKTPEGKAAVRLNALKHGLLSREVLLPGEDEEALRELGERLRDELQPVGELENLLVDRIIASYWRLRRLGRVEAGYSPGSASKRWPNGRSRRPRIRRGSCRVLKAMKRHHNRRKEARGGLSRARRMRSEQEDETATLGRTFARDADRANAFSKLSRYETAIERGSLPGAARTGAPASRQTRRCCHASPGFGRRGLGDARRDGEAETWLCLII